MTRTSARLSVIKNHKQSEVALALALMLYFTDTFTYYADAEKADAESKE